MDTGLSTHPGFEGFRAMAQFGSCSSTLAKACLAGSNQKEWNRAMARLKVRCASGVQDTWKFTSPSCSGGSPSCECYAPAAPLRASESASVPARAIDLCMAASRIG